MSELAANSETTGALNREINPNTASNTLARIGYSKDDLRTEEEKTAGAPLIRNDGLLGVELDLHSLGNLLREQGLNSKQISELNLTFSAAQFTDVDASGAYIGGLHKGNELVVFTSVPVKIHPEEVAPVITKSRFTVYQSAFSKEEVIDSLLHEIKHYVQYTQGVAMPNSWAAESKEVHDQLPTEKEAIEFAKRLVPTFLDKFRLSDEGGHFKPATAVLPKSSMYVTGLVNEAMVARFTADSLEAKLAHEFIGSFEGMMKQAKPLSGQEAAHFIKQGQELVTMKALAAYEFGFMLDNLPVLQKVA